MAKVICPECENEIDSLHYSQPSTDYGTFYFDPTTRPDRIEDNGSFDHDSSEGDGDIRYTCRECDHELEFGDLIYEFDNEVRITIKEYRQEQHNDQSAVIRGNRPVVLTEEQVEANIQIVVSKSNFIDQRREQTVKHVKCPKDSNIILVQDNEQEVECTECSRKIRT